MRLKVNVSKMPNRRKQDLRKSHNCIICWDPVSKIQQSKIRSKSVSTYSKKQTLGRIYSLLKLSWESYPSWDLELEESLSFCDPCTKGLEQLISLQKKLDQIRKEFEDGVDGVKRTLQESVSKSKVTSSSEARVREIRSLLLQGSVKSQGQKKFHPRVPSTTDVLRQNESKVSEEFAVSATVDHAYAQGFEGPHVFEAFNDLGIVEVQPGCFNVSMPMDNVTGAEEEEDNENEEEEDNENGEEEDNENEEEEDNENGEEEDNENDEEEDNESEEEEDGSYGMFDDSNDMDYEPATDVFQVEKKHRKIKKLEKKKVTRKRDSTSKVRTNKNLSPSKETVKRSTTRVSNKDSNSDKSSNKAISNEYFSPLEYTADEKMYYDGFEICKHPNGYICGACGFSSFSITGQNSNILRRMKIHIKGFHMDAYKCDTCGKKFWSQATLNQHSKRTHVPNAMRLICCKICEKPARSGTNMERHMWTHKSAEEKKEAEASGNVPRELIKEWRRKPHQCFKCGQVFVGVTDFKRHMEKHPDKDSAVYFKCTYPSCGHMFSKKSSRILHIKRLHEKPQAPRHVSDLKFSSDKTVMIPKSAIDKRTISRKVYFDLPDTDIVERETTQKDVEIECVEFESRGETDQDDSGKKPCSLKDGRLKRKLESFGPFTETEDGKLFYESYEVKKLLRGVYQCVSCETKFISRTDILAEKKIKRHINGVHLGRRICWFCNTKFPTKLDLKKHQKDVHYNNGQKICRICGGNVNKSRTRYHSWLHMNAEEMAACINSGLPMPYTFRLFKKSLGHEIHPEAKFICIECNEAFHSVFDLNKHCLGQHFEKLKGVIRKRSAKSQSESKDDTEEIKKPRTHQSIEKCNGKIMSSENTERDDLDYSSSANNEAVQSKVKVSVNKNNRSKSSLIQKIIDIIDQNKEDVESGSESDQEVGHNWDRSRQFQVGILRERPERFGPFTTTQDGELLFSSYKVVKLKKGAYKCVSCGSEFKSNYDKIAAREVKSHINSVHLGRYFFCPFCTKKFQSKVNLEKHKREAHVKRRNECVICGASVTKSYTRHHAWLHMNAEEMAACVNSGIRMPCTFRCLKQSRGHEIHPEAKFICIECNEAFHSVFDLDKHCSEQHIEKLKGLHHPDML